jgi:hypothetical protein
MALMVAADPSQERPLNRHGTENAQDELDGGCRLERPVREQAVKSHRDAAPGQDEHTEE